MMILRLRCALAAFVSVLLAGAAASAAPGDIIFTDELGNDTIRRLAAVGGVPEILYTSADPDERLAEIAQGPGGAFYVANGPTPPLDPSEASIIRIEGLFSGAPLPSTLASSDPLQNPIGLEYDPRANILLTTNNPGSAFDLPNRFEGVLGIALTDGTVAELYEEDPDQMAPAYSAGGRMARDASTGDFYVISTNGGTADIGGPDGQASVIFRMEVDPVTRGTTLSVLADLSNVDGSVLTRVRDITVDENSGDVFISEQDTNSIYRLVLDDTGSVQDVIPIATNLDSPFLLTYDPFNDRLVMSERPVGAPNRISAIELDGTGYQVLATGVSPRGMIIIPSSGPLVLFVLAAARIRRRRV